MKQLGKRFPGKLGVGSTAFFMFFLSACNEPIVYNQLRYGDMTGEIWDGHNANKIRIRCGKDCSTLSFQQILLPVSPKATAKLKFDGQQQRKIIRHFLSRQDKRRLVYVAPCDTWPVESKENRKLARWVANEVTKAGYSVWLTQPVVPYAKNPQVLCVNLLRGQLAVIPPDCPNLRVPDSVYRVSSDFGCSSNRSLATMISNPWDLLAPPGERGPVRASRITHGNMNYNNGVVAKVMLDTVDKTNADTSGTSGGANNAGANAGANAGSY